MTTVYQIITSDNSGSSASAMYATPVFQFQYGRPGSIVTPCLAATTLGPGVSVPCVNGTQTWLGYEYPGAGPECRPARLFVCRTTCGYTPEMSARTSRRVFPLSLGRRCLRCLRCPAATAEGVGTQLTNCYDRYDRYDRFRRPHHPAPARPHRWHLHRRRLLGGQQVAGTPIPKPL